MLTLRPAVVLLGLFTLLCGVAYPLTITGFAKAGFAHRANGSLIVVNGKT
ncbi:MAG: K+-transporting ATPase, c chain, partial [Myxococcaceae bacterium]|nr:K+-transporting ATPase, c chain [Myxococcaceae bacterium]